MQKEKCYSKEGLLSIVHEFAIVHSIEMNVLWKWTTPQQSWRGINH